MCAQKCQDANCLKDANCTKVHAKSWKGVKNGYVKSYKKFVLKKTYKIWYNIVSNVGIKGSGDGVDGLNNHSM